MYNIMVLLRRTPEINYYAYIPYPDAGSACRYHYAERLPQALFLPV